MDKQRFVDERLKDYQEYWDESQKRYLIEHDWTPTHAELVTDIERSYEQEHEVEAVDSAVPVRIVQIVAATEATYSGEELFWQESATIYGLGVDQQMYWWDTSAGKWSLHVDVKQEPVK